MGYQKKSYKKFVATAATATLVASAIVPVASASFTDVTETNEFATYINTAVEAGYVKGYADGTFGLNDNLKRSQVVIIIGRYLESLGYASEATTSPWSDVKDAEVIKYGNIVKEAGVFTGYANGTLNGAGLITRENMAVVLDRLAKTVTGTSLSEAAAEIEDVKVADLATANANYQGSIQALRDLGISTADNFNPKGNVKRGQFAKFIVTAVENIDAIAVVTAEDIAKEIAAVDATLPAVATIKADNAVAAKTAVEAAKTAITAIEAKIAKAEFTAEEVAELEKAITAVEAKYDAIVKAADKAIEDATNLTVESVKALNATQVEVKFSKAVKKSSVIADGSNASDAENTLVNGVFQFTTLDGKAVTADTSTAKLSEDGKTLVITSATVFEGRYDVVIEGAVDKDGKAVEKFKKVIDFSKDTVAPTIVSTEKVNANKVKVTFSEPITVNTAPTFKLENGTAVTGITYTTTDDSVTFDLSAAQVNGVALAANVNVIATFVGVQDKALNLLTPNPATVTLVKGAKDGVAPTVSTVTQTGAKEFTVKFSEELQANPTVTVTGTTVDTVKVDANDKTKYVVTTTGVLDGATTVAVAAGFKDLSGEEGLAYSKVYSFVKDVVAAKVANVAVVQDATDGKQYLEVTFDKNVALASATVTAEGTHVKDYVTTDVNATASVAYKNASDKKVVRVALSTLLTGTAKKVDAAYKLDLTFAGVTSETNVAVDSAVANFTLAADGSATTADKVKVSSVAQGLDNNKVVVTFDGNVDLATATTAANYSVDGAVVESAVATGDTTNVITLTLKGDSNGFTGIRNVTVKNVKKLNGTTAMDTQTIVSGSLNENVAPTVLSAELVATNKVKLTFSEAVNAGTAADFVLLVGGEEVTTAVATAATTDNTVLELTLTPAVVTADLTKGLAIKAATTLDIADLVGNKLSVPTAITIAQ